MNAELKAQAAAASTRPTPGKVIRLHPERTTVSPDRPERIDFVDNAKAIGILMVVVGHATGTPSSLGTLIYGVHMPLFFFLSGYLLSESRLTDSFRITATRLARTLLIPYVLFFTLSYLYWLGTRNVGSRAGKFQNLSWSDPLMGLASGIGPELFINAALWFLPCLFTVTIGYIALRKVLSLKSTLFLAAIMALAVIDLVPRLDFRLPWGLDIGWVALSFFVAGGALRLSKTKLDASPGWLRVAATCVLGGAFVLLVRQMGRVDLSAAHFGPNPALYLVTAFMGIAAVIVAASLWKPGRLALWLSLNTLIIFPTHPLVMNFASGLAKIAFRIPEAAIHSPAWAALSSVLGIAAAVPIGYVLRRTLPRVFRQSREERPRGSPERVT